MRICFDLDNTLCAGKPYEFAKPLPGAAGLLKQLKGDGHTVIIYTARGMGSCSGSPGEALAKIGKVTFDQLKRWGFEFDEIYFGKPNADVYIDDKAMNVVDLDKVRERIDVLCEYEKRYAKLGALTNS